jgi:hypothetical protein
MTQSHGPSFTCFHVRTPLLFERALICLHVMIPLILVFAASQFSIDAWKTTHKGRRQCVTAQFTLLHSLILWLISYHALM